MSANKQKIDQLAYELSMQSLKHKDLGDKQGDQLAALVELVRADVLMSCSIQLQAIVDKWEE